MKTYDIKTQRDGKFWFIEIPELDGATQAKRLNDVEEMARDYIAAVTDETDFLIHVKILVPEAIQNLLDLSSQHRQESERLNAKAAEEYRQAATKLKDDGLTVREIGQVLDISHQRAQQLISA
ncbi:MAG: hypothetical protein WBA28_05985 [Microbacteriaceae bacterium]